MSDSHVEINAKPLTVLDIKHALLDRGNVAIAELARRAAHDLGHPVTAWQVRAVIYRYSGVVYQELREWLAAYLGCEVWQVGNEPTRNGAAGESQAVAA
jgi:hypothetical protein